MNRENDDKLCKAFPELYAQRGGTPQETCMYWGFACGDGWFDLLWRLSERLSALPEIPVAAQVKEKFGGLRFYIDNGSDEAYDLIGKAEREASKTCETCGAPGKLRGEGWLSTRCSPCFENVVKRKWTPEDDEEEGTL